MISPRENPWSLVLVLGLLGSAAWAAEPNEIPIHLEFEISPMPMNPFSSLKPPSIPGTPNTAWGAFVSAKPLYAADIVIGGPTHFLPYPGRRTWDVFLAEFAMQHARLSEGQKALLLIVLDLFRSPAGSTLRNHIDPNRPEHLWLCAVTSEDARKMAVAYYQYAMREFQREVMEAENQLATQRENMETAQKRLAELEKTSATAPQALEELRKTVPYREVDEAYAAIGELDRTLNTARVEVAGITAKLEAIYAYNDRPLAKGERRVTSAETTAKLDAMLVEESIALRGAQAREQMATRLREQANRFIELKGIVMNTPGEKKAFTEALETARRSLSSWQETLEGRTQQKPKIPDKVVIYPVQWANEPSQN